MPDNPLIDIIENILLTPSSDFYIATILHDPKGNALDRRTIESLDLGTNFESIEIGITIKNLVVKGMSNVQVALDGQGNPEISADGDTVTFHAKLPNQQPGYTRPGDVPAEVEANGELDVSIGGTQMPSGTIALTISAIGDLTGVFNATEGPGGLSTVEVTFTSLKLNLDLASDVMKVNVTLPTVFSDTINRILNQPEMQQTFLDQINARLSSSDILLGLSQFATTQACAALNNTRL